MEWHLLEHVFPTFVISANTHWARRVGIQWRSAKKTPGSRLRGNDGAKVSAIRFSMAPDFAP